LERITVRLTIDASNDEKTNESKNESITAKRRSLDAATNPVELVLSSSKIRRVARPQHVRF